MSADIIAPDEIRLVFSDAMSAMYRAEVPLYGDLLAIVAQSNAAVLDADPALRARLASAGELERLDAERHGAIRVGTPAELGLMRRLFAVMGMQPVGYYDLAAAGLPVHSTAFRPVTNAALSACAFRIFCSLLRLDLITDEALRTQAADILGQRRIVNQSALQQIERYERDGQLSSEHAESFVRSALETFRWHHEALVDRATYEALKAAHPLVADIVCFRGPHINHLTPRALDIDAVQAAMIAHGMQAKAVIEGPPRRAAPVLLRQTSFQALEETILFRAVGATAPGAHTARFGEVEQRGIALTPRGRERYDAILAQVPAGPDYAARLASAFADLPDDLDELRREGLAYVSYQPTTQGAQRLVTGRLPAGSPEELIAAGLLSANPITYEDFLPVSAAGIFRSNLREEAEGPLAAHSSQSDLEAALGVPCVDPFALYLAQEEASLEQLVGAHS